MKTYTLSDGTEIKIKHFERCTRAEVTTLAAEGWLACQNEKHGDGLYNMGNSLKAIVAYIDGSPCAIMTWDHLKWKNEIWIHQGYVRASYRRKGVFGVMWNEMVEKAKELDVAAIEYGTHVRNTDMRSLSKTLGAIETSVTLRYEMTVDEGLETS